MQDESMRYLASVIEASQHSFFSSPRESNVHGSAPPYEHRANDVKGSFAGQAHMGAGRLQWCSQRAGLNVVRKLLLRSVLVSELFGGGRSIKLHPTMHH